MNLKYVEYISKKHETLLISLQSKCMSYIQDQKQILLSTFETRDYKTTGKYWKKNNKDKNGGNKPQHEITEVVLGAIH